MKYVVIGGIAALPSRQALSRDGTIHPPPLRSIVNSFERLARASVVHTLHDFSRAPSPEEIASSLGATGSEIPGTPYEGLGIFSWFGYELPLPKRLELIASAGFESTCLWFGVEEELVATNEADRIPELARGHGLKIDNVHAPYVGCNSLWTERDTDAILTTYDAAITFCHRHRIPVTVIHVTQGSSPPSWGRPGLERIRELARRAGEKDVVLAIENCGRPDYVDFLLSECDAHNLGLCYDSSHDFLNGNRSVEILKKWGHRVITTHFSDNHGENDDHWLPGDGTIDWEAVTVSFPAETYTGPVMLEVRPVPGNRMEAGRFLREAYGRAKWLAEKLG